MAIGAEVISDSYLSKDCPLFRRNFDQFHDERGDVVGPFEAVEVVIDRNHQLNF